MAVNKITNPISAIIFCLIWSWFIAVYKNENDKEAANLKFVEINKAYKTLTDEKARKNWEDYGNPDGPTSKTGAIVIIDH